MSSPDRPEAQEDVLDKAVNTIRALLGPVSLDVAAQCHELAVVVAAQGDLDLAGLLYERALAIKQQVLGSHDPGIAGTLHNLALLRQAEGRAEEAESLWSRALAALESAQASADSGTVPVRLLSADRKDGQA